MGFVCKKPLTLSGIEYRPGEAIPDGAILDSRVGMLKTSGHIVDVGVQTEPESTGAEVAKITIPIIGEDGEVLNVELTEGEVQHVFRIMQMNVENATEEIRKIQGEDELIAIHAADGRKSVQKAAKEQASYLNTT